MEPVNPNLKQPSLARAMQYRMDYLIARQGVVSSNIANSATPGYLAQDLTFVNMLRKASLGLDVTNDHHIRHEGTAGAIGKIVFDDHDVREDGNSVKMDVEMLKLNDVQINYRLMTNLYAKHAESQRSALGRIR